MDFLSKIFQSIYSPSFYKSLRKQSLSQAIKYFVLLCLVLSALFSVALIIPFINELKAFFYSVKTEYPQNLEVQVNKGIVKTNVKEPYTIALPGQSEELKNLAVIDTKTPFSLDKFDKYGAYIWVTKDSLFVRQHPGDVRAVSLKEVDNFKVNKSVVSNLVDKVSSFMPLIGLVAFVFILIVWYILTLFNFVKVFLVALVIWLLSKMMPERLTYKQSYAIGLYTITAGLLLSTLLLLIAPTLRLPFSMTLLAMIIFILNFKSDFKKKKKKK